MPITPASTSMRFCIVLILFFCPTLSIADWPVHRQNNQRNAKTEEHLDAARLVERWTWQSSHPPQPAWGGPAKWDAYAGIRDLKSMRNYDPVFHVVGSEGRIYFGSSVDHQVRCLDVETGTQQWNFTANGPIRIAPTFHEGKIYFGSDDGFAYCLQAEDGWPVWNVAAKQCDRQIVNNGNFISQWPIRTGVVIENGTAYFGASLLPWKESYLCAVDADSGLHDREGQYIHRVDEATMEGPLAIAPGKFIVAPQGRVAPQVYSIDKGTKLSSLGGGGGAFVVLTANSILHGPGNKTGWMTASHLDPDDKTTDKIASFNHANAIVIAGDVTFVLSDTAISAVNYADRKSIWSVDTECSFAMALAGNTLFASGTDVVKAYDAATGKLTWQHKVEGRAYGLAVSDGSLFVSTDEGIIHCFSLASNAPKNDAALATDTTNDAAESTRPQSSASGLIPVSPVSDKSAIGQWAFQQPHVKNARIDDLVGTTNGTIEGRVRLDRVNDLQAIELDGSSVKIPLTRELTTPGLPINSMTAEAWVRIDQPKPWGGVIGCLQDNGSFERGWLLGYVDEKPVFGLCSKGGKGKLTYLKSSDNYSLRTWHHFAATYDGKNMSLYVDGKLVGQSDEQNGDIHYPPSGVYVIGAYQDDNENFPLEGRLHEVVVYNRALSAAEIAKRHAAKASLFPAPQPSADSPEAFRPAIGPWLTFDTPSTATVRWKTAKPSTAKLRLMDGQTLVSEHLVATATLDHSVQLGELGRQRLYHYEIEISENGTIRTTPQYECDTVFNYVKSTITEDPTGYLDQNTRSARAAEFVMSQNANRKGLCVVMGCGDGSFMFELAKRSDYRIVAFDQDADRVERVRYALQNAGLYGERITVHHADFLDRLPVTSHVANLVVSGSILSGDETTVSFLESARLLAPGGTACFGQLSGSIDWMPGEDHDFKIVEDHVKDNEAKWAVYAYPQFDGAGEWSHIYGRSDNSHYGGESLSQTTKATEMVLQWIGRPGARYQSDRNGRKTPPLSTGGRIFLQGLDRMIAMDQYNGSILWTLETPYFRRFNMPRDCGNWCADAENVYAVNRDKCWRIDAARGTVDRIFDQSNPDGGDWGFVAREDQLLIGSTVKPGNIWTNFWGKEAWYDGTEGEVAAKVCSDRLFALDASTGEVVWELKRDPILNSTISISGGHIYFVESPAAKNSATRRLDGETFWKGQRLVAVNSATGEVVWDVPISTEPGKVVFYSTVADEKIILVSSNDKKYFVYAFSSEDGRPLWDQVTAWGKGKADHGSHLSRPAVVGKQLFVRPAIFDLETGTPGALRIPVGGCGTYAATDSALFFRGGSGNNSAMFNTQRGDYTMWNRLRPDCWLSTIPAGGMLLSPEGGGGCSCGKWMETSIGFIPKVLLDQ
ncbi:PQQ-binding-like beta-propeller repeat protein [Planctomycetota bacterium]